MKNKTLYGIMFFIAIISSCNCATSGNENENNNNQKPTMAQSLLGEQDTQNEPLNTNKSQALPLLDNLTLDEKNFFDNPYWEKYIASFRLNKRGSSTKRQKVLRCLSESSDTGVFVRSLVGVPFALLSPANYLSFIKKDVGFSDPFQRHAASSFLLGLDKRESSKTLIKSYSIGYCLVRFFYNALAVSWQGFGWKRSLNGLFTCILSSTAVSCLAAILSHHLLLYILPAYICFFVAAILVFVFDYLILRYILRERMQHIISGHVEQVRNLESKQLQKSLEKASASELLDEKGGWRKYLNKAKRYFSENTLRKILTLIAGTVSSLFVFLVWRKNIKNAHFELLGQVAGDAEEEEEMIHINTTHSNNNKPADVNSGMSTDEADDNQVTAQTEEE